MEVEQLKLLLEEKEHIVQVTAGIFFFTYFFFVLSDLLF